jgi:molybdopterin converting factor small subunit
MRISHMVKITIRYWAAAKEAAGIAEESLEAVTLRDALDAAVGGEGGGRENPKKL